MTQTEDAFKTAFKILQYFAVGLQQVLLDIVLYDGKMWLEFNKMENQLYQITCEIKLGMYSRGVSIMMKRRMTHHRLIEYQELTRSFNLFLFTNLTVQSRPTRLARCNGIRVPISR